MLHFQDDYGYRRAIPEKWLAKSETRKDFATRRVDEIKTESGAVAIEPKTVQVPAKMTGKPEELYHVCLEKARVKDRTGLGNAMLEVIQAMNLEPDMVKKDEMSQVLQYFRWVNRNLSGVN